MAQPGNQRLILPDHPEKASFSGRSFGADRPVEGEVVFNTGMSGYVETLTDPSYRGQILVLTYPLQGNYGVPRGPLEAARIQVQGLVVSHYSERPSHHASIQTLSDWLKSENIPALCGVDTRSLTQILREMGTTSGRIESVQGSGGDLAKSADHVEMKRVLDAVAPETTAVYPGGDARILLVDTGCKENIVRSLLGRGATVIRTPWNADWTKFLPEVDGVFLTNGPGDPADAGRLVEQVREVLRTDKPLFGICFGHQILSLAAGGKTRKMKYGHRSVNQPVKDLLTGRCYITSQNHGYVVDTDSLSPEWQPWFVNLNDGTNEGIRHRTRPIASVQFHPEASPGPHDTAYLFDEFVQTVNGLKSKLRKSEWVERLPHATPL